LPINEADRFKFSQLDAAHRRSIEHREEIERSTSCG